MHSHFGHSFGMIVDLDGKSLIFLFLGQRSRSNKYENLHFLDHFWSYMLCMCLIWVRNIILPEENQSLAYETNINRECFGFLSLLHIHKELLSYQKIVKNLHCGKTIQSSEPVLARYI